MKSWQHCCDFLAKEAQPESNLKTSDESKFCKGISKIIFKNHNVFKSQKKKKKHTHKLKNFQTEADQKI